MKFLSLLLLALSLPPCFAEDLRFGQFRPSPEVSRHLKHVQDDINRGKLAVLTDFALEQTIKRAVKELKKRGHEDEAAAIEWQFRESFAGFFQAHTRVIRNRDGSHSYVMYDIGDFKPFSEKLADLYNKIEFILGFEVCAFLRITDIKTFLYTPGVVFRPCSFAPLTPEKQKQEYVKHFAGDDVTDLDGNKYHGLVPVITYWVASFATPFPFSILVAPVVEYAMAQWVAPPLGRKIYDSACN